MANESIKNAFTQFWNHVIARTGEMITQANEYTDEAITSHTHNYAGSSSAGGAATSANKLNTNAGSNTQPVYFSNGVPVSTSITPVVYVDTYPGSNAESGVIYAIPI